MIDKPIIVTCGDPAGIGPEVVQKAWNELQGSVPMCMIADPRFLPLDIPYVIINNPAEAIDHCATALPILSHPFRDTVALGQRSLANACDVVQVIERGVQLLQQGLGHALCTAPIAKSVLQSGADFKHPGHTEFLAHLDQKTNVIMMLASPDLRVVPTTIHIPLDQVPTTLTPELLETTIRITHNALMKQFSIPEPRLAITGLNPHAGEDGRMGTEDDEIIRPVIQKLQVEGLMLTGPHPADTLFHAGARTKYDAAIAMYHDQALIPIKTLDFDGGVNVTLGLSFMRTSPDHGTAFDIAGRNIANPSSMIAALKLAAEMGQK
jgi:4-hydroxythreonine-4-phosphate dehydrogenase